MTGDKKVVIKINLPTSTENRDNHAGSSVRQVTEWNIKRLVIVSLILLLMFAGLLYLFLGSDANQDEYINKANRQNQISINTEKAKPPADISEAVDINETMPKSVVIETEEQTPVSDSGIEQDIHTNGRDIKETVVWDKDIKTSAGGTEVDITPTKAHEEPVVTRGVVRAQLATNINNKEPTGHLKLPFVVNKAKARALFYFTELKNMRGKIFYHQWNYQGKTVFKKKINVLGNRWRASTRKMIGNNNLGEWNVKLLDHKGHIVNEIALTVVVDD